MKKNDIYSLLVYLIMLGIAIATGLMFVRPTFAENSQNIPLNSGFLFILLSVVGSILTNAILIEAGHLIGAKIGGYEVYSTCVLWFTLRKKKGKMRFKLAGFDGLTGETKVNPKDVEKSNPSAMIYFPLLLLLVEVLACVVIIAVGGAFTNANNSWIWWKTFAIVFLSAAFMIHIYNIFPAQLDNKNDGYLFTILTNQTNKEAYNNMLRSEYLLSNGQKAVETPVYDKVTDFTSRINDITLYRLLDEEKYEEALEIVEKTIACEKDVSERIYSTAVANKISLMIMLGRLEEGKKYYISQPLTIKKELSEVGNAATLRAYILISSHVDESYGETKDALSIVETMIRRTVANKRKTEETMIDRVFEMVKQKHPDWDLSEFNEEENEKEDE